MQFEENEIDQKMTPDEMQERVDACTPVARQVIKLIAERIDEIELGKVENVSKTTPAIANDVLQLMLDNDVRWFDITFIMQLVLQPFAHVSEKLAVSHSVSFDKFIEKKVGKPVHELTTREVDAGLKA